MCVQPCANMRTENNFCMLMARLACKYFTLNFKHHSSGSAGWVAAIGPCNPLDAYLL